MRREILGGGRLFGSNWGGVFGIPLGGAPHPQPPGAESCDCAPGAQALGLPPQTSAASTQSSPRRRTSGSGCPGGQSRGTHETPESWNLIISVEVLQLRVPRLHTPSDVWSCPILSPPVIPETSDRAPDQTLLPTAGPSHSLALPPDVWPRLLPRPAPPADWLVPGRGVPSPERLGQRCRRSPPGKASAPLLPREWVPLGVVRSPSSVPPF